MALDYGDPELLVSDWIVSTLGIPCRADPDLRPDSWAMAPVAHVQRSAGFGQVALTLDDPVLDIDVYGADAGHVRQAAQRVWVAMTLDLPRHTFQPSGVFVKRVSATPPAWAPDPTAFRRTAAYSLVLHNLVVS
jgi:hypothetical protein